MGLEIINYTEYEEKLMEFQYIIWILLGFCIILGSTFLVYSIYKIIIIKEKELIYYIAGIAGVLIIIGWSTLTMTSYKNAKYDIENQSYIVYYGQITVGRKSGKSIPLYIPDEEGISLEYEEIMLDVDEGVYKGRVIYAEKSQFLLEIDIEEQLK